MGQKYFSPPPPPLPYQKSPPSPSPSLYLPIYLPLSTEKVLFYFASLQDWAVAKTFPWSKHIGKIHMPPDFNPFDVNDYYYRIYATGLGIRAEDTPERVKALLAGEKIEVSDVQLSKNGDFLAIYAKDLPNLLKIVFRTTTNGYILLPGRRGTPPPLIPSPPRPLPPYPLPPPLPPPHKLTNPHSGAEMSIALVVKKAYMGSNDPHLFKIKVERAPAKADPKRLLSAFKKYARKAEPLIVDDDLVCYLPHTRKGSAAATPYGFLWVRGRTAHDFFIRRAELVLRNTLLVFKVPESIRTPIPLLPTPPSSLSTLFDTTQHMWH